MTVEIKVLGYGSLEEIAVALKQLSIDIKTPEIIKDIESKGVLEMDNSILYIKAIKEN